MKKVLIFLLIVQFCSQARVYAGNVTTDINNTVNSLNTNKDQTQTNGIGTNDNQTVNEQSDNASKSNTSSSMMSTVAGGLLYAKSAQKAAQCSSKNPSACALAVVYAIMGGQAMKQGGENAKIAAHAWNTGLNTDAYGNGTYDSGLDKISKFPEIKSLDENLKKLQTNKAIAYDPKTGALNLNGKKLNISDLGSKSAMANAGLPSSLIDEAWSEAERISKEAENKVAALNTGSGGGGRGGVTDVVVVDEPAGESDYGNGIAGDKSRSDLRGPASVAGMSKSYFGTPIGVAADDIFLMMSRRYIVKDKQDSFFGKNDPSAK